MGYVFLVPRLGFNCEVVSDEINFIVWTGIGKKKKTVQELFSTLGLLCSLVNAREQGYQSSLEIRKKWKRPVPLRKKTRWNTLVSPNRRCCV